MKNFCHWCHQASDQASSPSQSVFQGNAKFIPCPQCQRAITLVTIRKACELVNVSKKTMYCWIGKSWVSTLTVASGRQMVCLSSLLFPLETSPNGESMLKIGGKKQS